MARVRERERARERESGVLSVWDGGKEREGGDGGLLWGLGWLAICRSVERRRADIWRGGRLGVEVWSLVGARSAGAREGECEGWWA